MEEDENLLINADVVFPADVDPGYTEANESGSYGLPVGDDDVLLSDHTPCSRSANTSADSHQRRLKRWDLNYHEAAIYLQEGENNDKFTAHPKNQESLPAYLITHNTWFYLLDLVAALLLLSLAFIEQPAVFKVHVGIHGSLELLCLLIITLELGMRLKWLGISPFLRHWRTMIKTVCLVIMMIEAITVLARQATHVRVTRAIRPLFLLDSYYLQSVRRFTRQIIQSLPAIIDMLVLLLFFMLLFSILGFYLFSDIPTELGPQYQYAYFQSLQDSFVSMFVLLTTANFPDVMMPYFAYSQWSAVFFIVYLSLELYLFMNLFLAVVYDAFQKNEKIKLKNLLLHKREACQHAFKLLVSKQNPNTCSLVQFEGLMRYYKKKMSRRELYLTFKAMNVTTTGKLTLDEFHNVYTHTTFSWQKKRSENYVWSATFCYPFNRVFKAINRLVMQKWFDYLIYAVIVVNFLWIVGDTIDISDLLENGNVNQLEEQQQPDLNEPDGMGDSDIEEESIIPKKKRRQVEKTSHAPSWIRTVHQYIWISSLFVAIYVIEAVLKILGFGPRLYFKSGWNIFDLLVTLISALGVLFEFVSQTFYYFLVFRPLRLLRLFKLKRRYRDVLGTIFILSSRFLSICIVMMVVFYFFSIIGMEIFALHDMRNCCVNTSVEMYYKYDNVTGVFGYYYLNNFDNIVITGVTLFEMTVVNNWYIIMDGYAAEFTDWSRIYFMLFYIVTMVIMTVVVSFVLEAFLFRIQYRTAMHGHDLDDDTIMRLEVSLSPRELHMCKNKNMPLCALYTTQQPQDTHQASPDNTELTWYKGERLRSKDDFSVIMYRQEVTMWIESEKQQQLKEEEEVVQEMMLQPNVVC